MRSVETASVDEVVAYGSGEGLQLVVRVKERGAPVVTFDDRP